MYRPRIKGLENGRSKLEAKAAAKFAPLLVSHAAERLGVMRREGDLKICGICGWDGRLVSARKNSCNARKPRRAF